MAKYQFPPLHMCNTEETGILTVQEPELFMALKGQKQQAISPYWKEKAMSVQYALADSLMSAMFIYIRLRMASIPEKDGVPAVSTSVRSLGTFHRLVAKHRESC